MANNTNIQTQPLFHGTDLRILKMSKEERLKFKAECILAIDYMWQFIGPYNEDVTVKKILPVSPEPVYVRESRLKELEPLLKDEKDHYIYNNLVTAVSCNELRLLGNSKYLYDYTYLTSTPHTAASYASSSWKFGEVGQIAYRFYQAIEKMRPAGWNPSDEIQSIIEKLLSFVNDKSEPVIVECYDYDLKYLFRDSGRPVNERDYYDGKLRGHYYYTGELALHIKNAIPFKEFVAKMDVR